MKNIFKNNRFYLLQTIENKFTAPTDYTDKAQKFSIPTTLLGHQSKTTMNIIFSIPKLDKIIEN